VKKSEVKKDEKTCVQRTADSGQRTIEADRWTALCLPPK
jgi:hypothetical protein